MARQLQFHRNAQTSIRKGVDMLADAVKITIGPKGRNVLLDHPLEAPRALNDGVTIARGIDLENPFMNMVVQLLKEAAITTNNMAGDGTTTATILVQALLHEGFKNIAAGSNPMILCKFLEKTVPLLVAEIRAMSKPVATHAEIAQVASIASGDPVLGEVIAEVIDHVGRDGIIQVEEGHSLQTEITYIEGIRFDRGYISPYMVTDREHMEAVLTNPLILITDKKISDISELLPLLERLMVQGQRQLLVIAEDIDGEALTGLIVNKSRGIFHVLGIRAPSFGDRREAVLEDLAIMTGGRLISEKVGRKLTSATVADLGRAGSVTVTKESTLIIDGAGQKQTMQSRIQDLHAQMDRTTLEYDREKLQERLANFAGGVGIIRAGGATEVEMKERKLRLEDSLAAAHSALEEGVVPGGGVTLVSAQRVLNDLEVTTVEQRAGVRMLRRALEEPLRQIARNAGVESSVVVARVRELPSGYGFDVLTEEYRDMFAAGILDPTRVVVSALQIALGIACLFLTTDTLITDAPVFIPDFKDIEFGL